MILIYQEDGRPIEGKIEPIANTDFLLIRNSEQYQFDWNRQRFCKVYKLTAIGSEEILGLISLVDISREFRIHVNLIEVSKENIGKSKKIANIAGCLLAFACREAFDRGYEGFVSLVPKTMLISHYINGYGFRKFGRILAITWSDSETLIQKYLSDDIRRNL